MSSTEQPPKKRKPYEPPQPPPASTPESPSSEPQPPGTQTNANAPTTTLTPEEISQKRRNQEEIRNFYESFKRLKYCIANKDAHSMPELEQTFLSLISASRGCTSVQRLVAEFVPKYSSHCPPALEAAANVCINIHNNSMAIINQGEDSDNFSFEIASHCVFGLVNICQSALSETPNSTIINGVCSAVFPTVLNFFITSFEGRGIFEIVNKDVVKMYDSPTTFFDLKKKFSEEDEAASVKLSKFRALCVIRIFFSCPKNSLSACFELCGANPTDGGYNGGQYFLNQVTAEDAYFGSKSCLLGLILEKDPSLRKWIFSTVNLISKSASDKLVSDITTPFERIFKSFTEEVKSEEKKVETNENNTRIYNPPKPLEASGSSDNSGGPKPMDLDSMDHKELPRATSSTPNSNQMENNNKFNLESPNPSISWYSDGNSASMDIYTASRSLFVGSLGPEASEQLVRFQFERFGPIDMLLYVPLKGFAVIEYKNIMDAIKAREVMRGRSVWGSCLSIKFLDVGLGTKGDINGVAVGSSCHVYVGNIQSQLDKDEIMFELRKAGFKCSFTVHDLVNEGALLMEFLTPEEAASVMVFLRQRRKEKKEFHSNVDLRNNNHGSALGSSPHGQTMGGFSHRGNHHANTMELNSPRNYMVNQGATMQSGYPFQSNYRGYGTYETNMVMDPSQAGGHMVPHSTPMQGHNYATSSSYMRPVYYPPHTSWDPHGMMHHHPPPPHHHVAPPPFIPPSVTPLAQMQGNNSMPPHDQMFYVPPPPLPPQTNMLPPQPNMPPPPLPPQPTMPPPLPPTPPPLLESQPPPPPPPPIEPSGSGVFWQGTLSKSGVHYATINAHKLHSEACNYGDSFSEPTEWPNKLDITKRTDFKHVKSTFSSTPPHKREVCQLLPTSAGDQKGFGDFISYLKQRECAGVIKIAATKTIWSRLVFILPYSQEICSLLSVAPDTTDCLIALVLPKETNFEWV